MAKARARSISALSGWRAASAWRCSRSGVMGWVRPRVPAAVRAGRGPPCPDTERHPVPGCRFGSAWLRHNPRNAGRGRSRATRPGCRTGTHRALPCPGPESYGSFSSPMGAAPAGVAFGRFCSLTPTTSAQNPSGFVVSAFARRHEAMGVTVFGAPGMSSQRFSSADDRRG